MKVYVFTRVYAPVDEYVEITDVEVFTSIEDAKARLKKERDSYLRCNEDGDSWHITYETDTYCHLWDRNSEEESVMTIEEHDI